MVKTAVTLMTEIKSGKTREKGDIITNPRRSERERSDKILSVLLVEESAGYISFRRAKK